MNLIARTGQKDIDSNKGKNAPVNFPEPHQEPVLGALTETERTPRGRD